MGRVRDGAGRRIAVRLRLRGMVVEENPPPIAPAVPPTEIAQPPAKRIPKAGWGN